MVDIWQYEKNNDDKDTWWELPFLVKNHTPTTINDDDKITLWYATNNDVDDDDNDNNDDDNGDDDDVDDDNDDDDDYYNDNGDNVEKGNDDNNDDNDDDDIGNGIDNNINVDVHEIQWGRWLSKKMKRHFMFLDLFYYFKMTKQLVTIKININR